MVPENLLSVAPARYAEGSWKPINSMLVGCGLFGLYYKCLLVLPCTGFHLFGEFALPCVALPIKLAPQGFKLIIEVLVRKTMEFLKSSYFILDNMNLFLFFY